jgi:hypothetical protein
MMLIDCSKVYDEIVEVVVQPWFGANGGDEFYTLELKFEFSCDNVIWREVKDGNECDIFKKDFAKKDPHGKQEIEIPTC